MRTHLLCLTLLLTGCASTSVTITPPNPNPICAADSNALVLWATQWRADQKDIPQREVAAEKGITSFFKANPCFQSADVRRLSNTNTDQHLFDKTVVITVRELGPVVKLFSSPALIDGGTEVVLDIAEYAPQAPQPAQSFKIHWENGGGGVIKGVSSLAQDMQSALKAGLQPPVSTE